MTDVSEPLQGQTVKEAQVPQSGGQSTEDSRVESPSVPLSSDTIPKENEVKVDKSSSISSVDRLETHMKLDYRTYNAWHDSEAVSQYENEGRENQHVKPATTSQEQNYRRYSADVPHVETESRDPVTSAEVNQSVQRHRTADVTCGADSDDEYIDVVSYDPSEDRRDWTPRGADSRPTREISVEISGTNRNERFDRQIPVVHSNDSYRVPSHDSGFLSDDDVRLVTRENASQSFNHITKMRFSDNEEARGNVQHVPVNKQYTRQNISSNQNYAPVETSSKFPLYARELLASSKHIYSTTVTSSTENTYIKQYSEQTVCVPKPAHSNNIIASTEDFTRISHSYKPSSRHQQRTLSGETRVVFSQEVSKVRMSAKASDNSALCLRKGSDATDPGYAQNKNLMNDRTQFARAGVQEQQSENTNGFRVVVERQNDDQHPNHSRHIVYKYDAPTLHSQKQKMLFNSSNDVYRDESFNRLNGSVNQQRQVLYRRSSLNSGSENITVSTAHPTYKIVPNRIVVSSANIVHPIPNDIVNEMTHTIREGAVGVKHSTVDINSNVQRLDASEDGNRIPNADVGKNVAYGNNLTRRVSAPIFVVRRKDAKDLPRIQRVRPLSTEKRPSDAEINVPAAVFQAPKILFQNNEKQTSSEIPFRPTFATESSPNIRRLLTTRTNQQTDLPTEDYSISVPENGPVPGHTDERGHNVILAQRPVMAYPNTYREQIQSFRATRRPSDTAVDHDAIQYRTYWSDRHPNAQITPPPASNPDHQRVTVLQMRSHADYIPNERSSSSAFTNGPHIPANTLNRIPHLVSQSHTDELDDQLQLPFHEIQVRGMKGPVNKTVSPENILMPAHRQTKVVVPVFIDSAGRRFVPKNSLRDSVAMYNGREGVSVSPRHMPSYTTHHLARGTESGQDSEVADKGDGWPAPRWKARDGRRASRDDVEVLNFHQKEASRPPSLASDSGSSEVRVISTVDIYEDPVRTKKRRIANPGEDDLSERDCHSVEVSSCAEDDDVVEVCRVTRTAPVGTYFEPSESTPEDIDPDWTEADCEAEVYGDGPVEEDICLRLRVNVLLWALLGGSRLRELGWPREPVRRVLWRTVDVCCSATGAKSASAVPLPANHDCGADMACFRDHAHRFLEVCAPTRDHWKKYGWASLTIDAVVAKVYKEDVLPWLLALSEPLVPACIREAVRRLQELELPETTTSSAVPSSAPVRKKRGRPAKANKTDAGRVERVMLWRFLLNLLEDPRNEPCIHWLHRDLGIFRILNTDWLARLWGRRHGNPRMTYEKMARAMRTYYRSKVLQPVPRSPNLPRKLVYKFNPAVVQRVAACKQRLKTTSPTVTNHIS